MGLDIFKNERTSEKGCVEIDRTTERSYLLKLIEQIEMVIKRMRWKVIYCNMKGSIKTETYGLKSHLRKKK